MSSVNAYRLENVLEGPYGAHIWTIEGVVVLAVEEQMKQLYNTADLIIIIKNATFESNTISPMGAQISSPLIVTTILHARTSSTKISTRRRAETKPLSSY